MPEFDLLTRFVGKLYSELGTQGVPAFLCFLIGNLSCVEKAWDVGVENV